MAKASAGAPGSAAHAAHIVGAPLITVTPWSTTDSSADCGSNRSMSSTVAPATKLQPEHHVEPEDVEQRQHAEHDVVGALLAAGVRLALLEVRRAGCRG